MAEAVRRQALLVGAVAELGRLQAFRDEALDRPGVDELVARLRIAARWVSRSATWMPLTPTRCISFAQSSRVFGSSALTPVSRATSSSACLTNHDTMPGLAPQQLTAVTPPGRRLRRSRTRLAERIVRALRQRELRVVVEACPRLGDRVDVVAVQVLAEVHDVDRRGVDRHVDDHAAARPGVEQRGQHLAVVGLGQADLDELELALVEQPAVGVDRVDADELRAVERDVPLQQRQEAAADRAEADHHNGAVETGMNRPVGHASQLRK